MSKNTGKITQLAETVKQNDGRAMLVGGCVRDRLMGVEPKDWDLEIYGVEPRKLREILDSFGKVDAVGEAFTVYKIGQEIDVALPRRERKTGRGHKGFVVEGDPHMSFREAARRRDFTVNAIMQDALTGEIVDEYDGRADIGIKFCALFPVKPSPKTVCAFCAPRSSPRVSSLRLTRKRGKSAAQLI
jgi:tRNA nucleotidyltransferase (CCA-adding enzyme)